MPSIESWVSRLVLVVRENPLLADAVTDGDVNLSCLRLALEPAVTLGPTENSQRIISNN